MSKRTVRFVLALILMIATSFILRTKLTVTEIKKKNQDNLPTRGLNQNTFKKTDRSIIYQEKIEDEGNIVQEEHIQNKTTAEITGTLQNNNSEKTVKGNTTPPDGRIYYPTSSESPYGYTPTNTPKENKIPIITLEPEN